ncbi:MAG: dipeptidase PepE [Flavobacterium sp.]|nr:dipeptidase PepE [Flavobacterium sp.]
MTKAIIASTSTIHGGEYLGYLLPHLETLFKNCQTILFIPYARPSGISYDAYTKKVKIAFAKINKNVVGLHEFENPNIAIQQSEGIFTGGGNTFLLVKQLHDIRIMKMLSNAIKSGIPYLGTSAGSNITGVSMQTTNDMPIVYPSSFETLGIIPFDLNPHYLDADLQSLHMGETRETRIKEFHAFNETPVIGLREGSWLEVMDTKITLKGSLSARFFEQNRKDVELESGYQF